MVRCLVGVACLAALGCAGPLGAAGGPKQLREIVKIKDANITCVVANTPWGKGSALLVNLDKGVIPTGSVTVDDACKLTLTSGPKAP